MEIKRSGSNLLWERGLCGDGGVAFFRHRPIPPESLLSSLSPRSFASGPGLKEAIVTFSYEGKNLRWF